ncbi:MAG: hypothetical protein V7K35_17520 [Nostoc sp.]|uniref:hypothetical protein n=1 Tax=Nostoc sp. TaxID=1180 RepID=UPI002FF75C33
MFVDIEQNVSNQYQFCYLFLVVADNHSVFIASSISGPAGNSAHVTEAPAVVICAKLPRFLRALTSDRVR